MMTEREARTLSVEIEEHGCRVTGERYWGRDSVELSCEDPITGYPFVVGSREDWEERIGPSKGGH